MLWEQGRKDSRVWWGARVTVNIFRFKKSKTLSTAQEEIKLDIGKFLLRYHKVIIETLSALL